MKRREFITLLSAAAAAWPLTAPAQQMPVIGYLSSLSPDSDPWRISALRQSLAEAGYSEGVNLAFEYRWAEGNYDRLAAQAAELVRRGVAVIFAASLPSALAAKAVTTANSHRVRDGRRPGQAPRRRKPQSARRQRHRRLRRARPQGHAARRASDRAADQVRAGDQPQDRESARPHRAADAASRRRRGDRVKVAG